MKPALIPDWRDAWRWFSVQAMTLAVALQGAWLAVPDDLRVTVPPLVAHGITIGLLVFGIVGRLIDQPIKVPPCNQ